MTRDQTGNEPRRTDSERETTKHDQLSPKARRLAAYLRERVEADEECYLKSRFIADEIELSAKQIGSYMSQLQHSNVGLSIEKWGYTNGTTWRVTR